MDGGRPPWSLIEVGRTRWPSRRPCLGDRVPPSRAGCVRAIARPWASRAPHGKRRYPQSAVRHSGGDGRARAGPAPAQGRVYAPPATACVPSVHHDGSLGSTADSHATGELPQASRRASARLARKVRWQLEEHRPQLCRPAQLAASRNRRTGFPGIAKAAARGSGSDWPFTAIRESPREPAPATARMSPA